MRVVESTNVMAAHMDVKKSSPDHLMECLARYLDSKRSRFSVGFLAKWEKNHGKKSADALKLAVNAAWQKRQTARRDSSVVKNNMSEIQRILSE